MAKGKRNTRNNSRNKTLKKVESELSEDVSLKSRLIVVVCVLAFIGLFYLLAIHITNKNANVDPNENVNESSDYSEILLGSTFNRNESEYIVVYFDKDNEEINSTIGTAVLDYVAKEDNLTTYTVDMSNMYNKNYNTTEDTNKSPNNVDELRINGPTLIKISKGNVVEYIEGLDAVKDYLG